MKIVECKQGSAEWHFARLGIPTASQFSRIITPKTRKPSASADSYMHELLSEWLLGMPAGGAVSTPWMQRGTEQESSARMYFEIQTARFVREVGLCVRAGAGCSPDGLLDDDEGLEIKCPSAVTHIATMLNGTDEHFAQIQGSMWVTERKAWFLLSYNPSIPSSITRIERDESYMAALDVAVPDFVAKLGAARQKLLDLGCTPATQLNPEFAATLHGSN